MGYGLRLSRVMAWVVYHLKRKFKCKTLQEERETWMPKPLNYAKLMSGDMMVVVIAISYAIISPMILPFTIAYFAFALVIMQNQVSFLLLLSCFAIFKQHHIILVKTIKELDNLFTTTLTWINL